MLSPVTNHQPALANIYRDQSYQEVTPSLSNRYFNQHQQCTELLGYPQLHTLLLNSYALEVPLEDHFDLLLNTILLNKLMPTTKPEQELLLVKDKYMLPQAQVLAAEQSLLDADKDPTDQLRALLDSLHELRPNPTWCLDAAKRLLIDKETREPWLQRRRKELDSEGPALVRKIMTVLALWAEDIWASPNKVKIEICRPLREQIDKLLSSKDPESTDPASLSDAALFLRVLNDVTFGLTSDEQEMSALLVKVIDVASNTSGPDTDALIRAVATFLAGHPSFVLKKARRAFHDLPRVLRLARYDLLVWDALK